MFTIRSAQDLVYLTYVDWAHRSGLLDGRRIGVFSDRYTATSAAIAIDRLTELGHAPLAHVRSDGVGVGSEHGVEAAEHFRGAGVDVVVPFVSGSSMARMLPARRMRRATDLASSTSKLASTPPMSLAA